MERSFQTLTADLSEEGQVGNKKLMWLVLNQLNREAQEAGQVGRLSQGDSMHEWRQVGVRYSSRSGCRLLQSWRKIHTSAGHKGPPD